MESELDTVPRVLLTLLCPEELQPLCSCSVFPLVQPFCLQRALAPAQLAFHLLSVCVRPCSLLLDVAFASDHAYRMSHLATHIKSSLELFAAAAEREKDTPSGTQQCGGDLDVVGLSAPSSLGDAKIHKRPAATFSVFCMCAEFRHKTPILTTNRVRTLCGSYNFALLSYSSKAFITPDCLQRVQSIRADLCSGDAPQCLVQLETLSAHSGV